MTVEVVGFIVLHPSNGMIRFFDDRVNAERHAAFFELQAEPVVRAISYTGVKMTLDDTRIELVMAKQMIAKLEKQLAGPLHQAWGAVA